MRVMGLLPPFWSLIILLAFGGLCALTALRTSAPALLLSGLLIIPWIGIPFAPLLIWLGPLSAWLWVMVATVALGPLLNRIRLADSPTIVALVACGVLALMNLVGDPHRISGDEPHYLIVANSLLQDGDVELTNDYDEARHQAFYPGSLEPRHTVLSRAGRQYSFHGLGVPVLVVPGFAFGGVIGARSVVILVTVVGITFLWAALRRATRSPTAAWAGIAALLFQIPFAVQGSALYPDGVAAAITSLSLWLLLRIEGNEIPRTEMLIMTGCALAALPWLHIRLAVVAVIFGLSLSLTLWRHNGRWSEFSSLFSIPVAGAFVWFASFWVMFETWDPTAPFREKAAGSLAGLPTGSLGLLADHEYGLLPYAPALVFVAGGFLLALKTNTISAWCGIAVLLSTLGVGASYVWFGGTSSPARFLVPSLPFASYFLAMWWSRASDVFRATYVLSVAWGAILWGFGSWAEGGARLTGEPDGRFTIFEWVNTLVDIPAALPSLFRPGTTLSQEALVAAGWVVTGAVVLTVVARLSQSSRRSSSAYLVAAWGLVGWLSTGLELGWRIRGIQPWTPDVSQASLLRARARSSWLQNGLSREGRFVQRDEVLAGLAFEAPGFDNSTLLVVPDIPPGRYRIGVSGAAQDPRTRLTLELGRDAWPIWSWNAASASEAPDFVLVTPVHSLRVLGRPPQPRMLRVRLLADARGQSTVAEDVALRVTRYTRWLVYSLDRWTYMETGGFWTAGDRSARIVVAEVNGMSDAYALQLEAGPAAVQVRLRVGHHTQEVGLDAGHRTRVVVPAMSSPAPLDVAVRGGFDAASAFSNPADRRWLGVWVSIERP